MLNPRLQPFLQLVEYTTNYHITNVKEQEFSFISKRKILEGNSLSYHIGEKADFTVLLEENKIWIAFNNNGYLDEISGFRALIEHIDHPIRIISSPS